MAHWIIEDDGERVWGLTDDEEAQLLSELEGVTGKWAAIHERSDGSETVVGSGDSVAEAKASAKANGHEDVCLRYVGGGCDTALLPKRAPR